jgi:hypothetical protein
LEANKEGYSCLLSGGTPDSPVHHRTVTVACPVRISSLFGRDDRCSTVAVGAPDSPVPLPTVGAGHASPADCAADRCAGGHWLTGQSGAPPNSPVNYSRTPPNSPESGLFTGVQPGAPDTVRCTTRHCPVHHRTVRCVKPSWSSVVGSQTFAIQFISSFLCF